MVLPCQSHRKCMGINEAKTGKKKIKNSEQLIQNFKLFWNNLSIEYVDRLVKSCSKNFQAIIDSIGDGYYIKYCKNCIKVHFDNENQFKFIY